MEEICKNQWVQFIGIPSCFYKQSLHCSVLPHVGLTLLSLMYIVGGAFVFYTFERENEVRVR